MSAMMTPAPEVIELAAPTPSPTPPAVLADFRVFVEEGKAIIAQLPSFLTQLVLAALIVVAGLVAIKLARKLVRHVFKLSHKRKKLRDEQQSRTLESLIVSLCDCLLTAVMIIGALSVLGVDVTSLLAIAGIGGVAIGFGAQTLIKDFISGMFLWTEERIKMGDTVTIAGQTGTVENVALRTTVLRGVNGNQYVVPNGDIRTVINMTRGYRNAVVDITVAHGQDYRRAITVLDDAMLDLSKRLALNEPPSVEGVIASDARAATVRIICRCDVSEVWALEREIRLTALEAFVKESIRP